MHRRALGHNPRPSSTTSVADRLVVRHPQLNEFLDARANSVPLLPVASSNPTTNPFVQSLKLLLAKTKMEISHPALEVATDFSKTRLDRHSAFATRDLFDALLELLQVLIAH